MSEVEGQVPQEAVEPETEVTEQEFEAAEKEVEAKGITPDMPTHNAELSAQWNNHMEDMKSGKDANPSEWGSHESVN